jgi:hypothetical protein
MVSIHRIHTVSEFEDLLKNPNNYYIIKQILE